MYTHDKFELFVYVHDNLSCTYTISKIGFIMYVHDKLFGLIVYVHDKFGFIVYVHDSTYKYSCGGNTLPFVRS